MNNITIRIYDHKDWDCIEKIHDRARKIELDLAGLEDAFVPLKEAAINENLFDYIVNVAIINKIIVGFVAYSENEIAWLYVDPDYTRRGIAKNLIMHVIENTTNEKLELEVLAGNSPAIYLYEKMGFKTNEICSGSMPGNEKFQVTVHCMELNKLR